MRTELYWIPGMWPGRIGIMPRPRGGDWLEDEVRGWRDAGVDVVVSLLQADEAADLELPAEGEYARKTCLAFVSFPVADREVPESVEAFDGLVGSLADRIRDGKSVAIHCRQGIGRAGLVAVSLLIRLGVETEEAIARVSTARGRAVPETPEQREWLLEFARRESKTLPA